ncbi:MAG: UDP-3-O-(3-hydroxymyristoyl)glucosamine N-acyltransferase, partial [Phycisphaerales bacterium]|nr:UDP-3-O-(3-hydroxymyristoyl)glucosamine N-acyltransferase [Phycisphaerales bacterium]
INTAGADEISFLANAKYTRYLATTTAAAVIVGRDVEAPPGLSLLVAEDPYYAFRNAMIVLHDFRPHPTPMDAAVGSISPAAHVHPDAIIDPAAIIHPNATVEAGASIGSGTVLYPNVYVGPEAVIGTGCTLYPNVTIYDRCRLGDRVTVHASSVIGCDGFGYATHAGRHHKIPQNGIVIIEDDVEIGAACAIERAAMGATVIGAGTKFADLISIGHGTTIGEHCLIVSLVGVAGSVEVGKYVALGGQVGVSGHLRIGDFVRAAGKTAIIQDVADGEQVGGIPAVTLDQAKRNALAGMDLYGIERRLRKLERELARRSASSKRGGDDAAGTHS